MNKQNIHRGYKLNYFTKIWEIVNGEISAALNFLTRGDNKFYNFIKSIFNQFMEKNMNQNKLFQKFGALLVLLLFLAGSAFAQTTWYVNTTNGSDNSNTGTEAGSAFKTINKAIQSASDSDTISVAGGTYNEGGVLNVNKSVVIVVTTFSDGSSTFNEAKIPLGINIDASGKTVTLAATGKPVIIGKDSPADALYLTAGSLL